MVTAAVEKSLNFLGCDENRRSTRPPRSSAASVVRKSVESVPSVYSPMGGGGVMPAFSNLPSAASSAAYFQNLSSQYAPSLFGSTTLGSAAYGLGQGEVNGAVNAWNYVSSNAPALVEHPSAFLPGIAQGGANLINSAENFAIGAGNSLISVLNLPDQAGNGIAWLVGSGATPFTIIPQVPYATWSNNLFVQNDPAHNVEMALNTAGLTGLSFGSAAIPEMAGYVSNAGNLVDASAATTEWSAPQGWRLPVNNGEWSGVPGNSFWKSNIPEVNQITGNHAIPFNQGYIDLSYYSVAQYAFPNLTGTGADFAIADQQLAIDQGFSSTNAARVWRTQNSLTWHHVEDGQILQLVPSVLNDIPHQGGAAMIRGQ